ncbi:MAG: trypsin-like peptidase domain-containing protein [bacterium]|nr:trypsin-like peptidase domain-containing protein [bacterium]
MAPDQPAWPADPGEDPFEDRPANSGAFSEPGPSVGGAEPGTPADQWPRDYDLAWTLGSGDQGPPRDPGPPGGRRRRRRFSAQAFAVLVSLSALALGVVAVVQSTGAPGETVRYIPVRPPEIIGPAPQAGAGAPVPPPAIVQESPQSPVAAPQPPVASADPAETVVPAPAPAPAPAQQPSAVPAPPTGPAQEPVVFAAGRVEPSVVLLQTSQGQGSGIIYDDAGLILTAAHVVEDAEPLADLFAEEGSGGPGRPEGLEIDPSRELDLPEALGGEVPDVIVHLPSGLRTGGKVVGANRELDVAVIQIDPALDVNVADIGSLSTVQVGQTAVAVGSPFGRENVVTVGVVSALNQVLGGQDMPPLGMIQTDAPINPGNSGGALADLEGRVIGMNVAIQSNFGGGNIGVGFATPIEVAIWIAEELRAGREVRFGFLGITGYTPPLGEPGAIVASVTPDGPAEAAGMQVNDRIVSFDGQPVGSMDELTVAVRLRAPGTEVRVEVVRGDQLIRLFIPLGDRSASLALQESSEESPEPEIEP